MHGVGHLLVQREGSLVVDFGFGEQEVYFVILFLHFVLLLFAGVFLFHALLRFKALAKLRIITKAERKCFERGAWSL
jgi:hypothetical protein